MPRTQRGLMVGLVFACAACGTSRGTPDTTPPKWPDGAVLSASAVTPASATFSWPAAIDEPSNGWSLPSLIRYRLSQDGVAIGTTVTLTFDVSGLALGEGHVFKVEASDAAGNWTSDGPEADVAGAPSPPIAPPLDRTVATNVCGATHFLYEGPNAIQQGVAPGTLRCAAVALLRGRVLAASGEGLGGVRISVKGHPEWGITLSQGDGQFDFVVEAGQHTLDFRRSGHFPAQRVVMLAAREWGNASDVVLKKADKRVTAITLAQGGLHTSTAQTDKDGTRNTWLYFPPGTTASLTLPDGGTQAVDTVHVRATEYTVGPLGEQAMPADLPPTSGYGFASEFSVDEVLAAGADGVDFTQPITFFIDNFRHLPPGAIVPLGFYDLKRAKWVAEPDARVVTLVSVTGGKADFDLDGDGKADAMPGATDAERIAAAGAFAVGAQLWRGTVRHFTAQDTNFGEICVSDAPGGPPHCSVPNLSLPSNTPVCASCSTTGSDIDVHNQTLGEDFEVAGTPFTLRYQSDRSLKPGQGANFKLNIPWVSGTQPLAGAGYDGQLEVKVAGKKWSKQLGHKPMPGEVEAFTWDGKDAYGRVPQAPMPVTVALSYRNRTVPGKALVVDFNFLETGGPPLTITSDGRGGLLVTRTWSGFLGAWYSDAAALGGLSLSVLHQYVASQGQLFKGDGTLVQADALGATLESRVGGGTSSADDVPGTQARAFLPTHLAAGPDGQLYYDDDARMVRRVALDGTVRTVAGLPSGGVEGDGVPALQARFTSISGLASDRLGNLFIADFALNRIYRVDTAGIIHAFAGTGVAGFSGDGADPLKAQLKSPAALLVTPDGDVYFFCINSAGLQVLRRVREGVISTVAGGGSQSDFSLDSIEALKARFNTSSETSAGFGADGSIYFSEPFGQMVRRLGPDGRVYRVAGTGMGGFSGDNGPALQAQFSFPTGLAVRSDGSVYICDATNQRVRRVRPDGNLETAVGNGTQGTAAAVTGTPALRAALYQPAGLAMMPDDTLALAERAGARVRLVRPSQATLGGPDTLILPSEDGDELYVFTLGGKHLKTLDGLTKALRYQFNYLPSGVLDSVVDAFGNTTAVVRDAAGLPLALKSPDGLLTTLKLDAEGRATSVINPANEEAKLAYGADGLLASLTDARGNASHFEFDNLGHLTKDSNAAGGSKNLLQIVNASLTSTSVITAEGRSTKYDRQYFGQADVRTNTFPGGAVSLYVRNRDGSSMTTAPDLTTVTTQLAPDSRFGLASPVAESIITQTPSGLKQTVASTRTVTLSNPLDPLSDTRVDDIVAVNGKAWKRSWDGAARTLTLTSPLGRQALERFDTSGLLVEERAPGQLPVTTIYDARGRPSQALQGLRATTVAWGSEAFPQSVTDALARPTQFQWDAVGRPTKVTGPDSRLLQASYDSMGNVVVLTPPGKPNHDFSYSPISLLASYTPPALPGAGGESYAYDLDGLLESVTHPDGAMSQYQLDLAGRLRKLVAPWGTYDFGFDAATGQLKSAAHGGQSLTWSYDGFLTTAETATGAVSGTIAYGFDANFRVNSLSVNGSPVVYAFDDDGLLTQAGALTLTRSSVTGQVTGATLGVVGSGWTYDAYGAPESSSASVSGAAVFQETLTRDALARITGKVETMQGVTTNWTYAFDTAGRLQQVTKNGVSSGTYLFDANGNRISANGVAATFDAQDRELTSGAEQFKLDAFGSLVEKRDTANGALTQYQVDGNGGLRKATLPDNSVLDYLVDARGRRVGKKRNGTLEKGWLYDGQLRIVAELDGSGAVTGRFVYGTLTYSPDYMVRGGVTYRLVHDSLGSVRLVINAATGVVAQRMDYDEWGVVLADSAPGFQPFGYAGGLTDGDTELVRFGARDYAPALGRWTSKDPSRFEGRAPNLYEYAGNGPLDDADPSGRYSISGGCADDKRRLREAIERNKKLRDSQNQCSSYLSNVANLAANAMDEGPVGPRITIEPGSGGSYTSWNGDIHLSAADVGNDNIVLHEFAHYGDIASSGALNVALRGRRAAEALGVGAEQSCNGRSGSGDKWKRFRQWPW